MIYRLASGILVAGLLIACGSDDDSGAPPSFDFTAVEAEVDSYLAEAGDVEGAGLILLHRDHGAIFRRGFGAFSEDRIYLLASSSKMVTAGVLMNLQDRGILDMDEPIVDVVGWGGDNLDITPAQLVSNSSGLVGLLPNPAYGPYLCQYLSGATLAECGEQIFTTTGDDEDVIPPDTTFRYGGAQWQVAGAIAETVAGKSWAELIDEIYTRPCGLEVFAYNNHFTVLTSPDNNPFGYPEGFDGDPGSLPPTDNPNMEAGAYSNLDDYGKLLMMHLRGGLCGENRVLSEDAVARMHSDRIAAAYGGTTGPGRFMGYGLGWWIDRSDPSLTADPGAYGAFPWIDEGRDYAGFIAMEAGSGRGAALFERIYPLVNEAIENAG
jgi:CubicO group peptidase (beta-lactamase class C family)